MSDTKPIPAAYYKPETFTQQLFSQILREIEAFGRAHVWARRELPRLTVGLVDKLHSARGLQIAFHCRACDEAAVKKQKRPMVLFDGEYAQWLAPRSDDFRDFVWQALALLLLQQRFVQKKTLHWKYDGKIRRKGTFEALTQRAHTPIYKRLGFERHWMMVRPTSTEPTQPIASSAWSVDWVQPRPGQTSGLMLEPLGVPVGLLERAWDGEALLHYDESPRGLRRGYAKIKNMRVTAMEVL